MIRRREFIAGLGSAAAWPLAVRAQQQTKPTIGWLDDQPEGRPRDFMEAFRRGLAEIGFLEGRDVTVEYHTTDGPPERLPGLVADLVLRMVAVIFASTTASAVAAKAATRTIPVVFEMGADPVELGLVASLNRPGGNLTGVVSLGAEIAAKRLELLHKLVPAIESIAMLVGPADPYTQARPRSAMPGLRVGSERQRQCDQWLGLGHKDRQWPRGSARGNQTAGPGMAVEPLKAERVAEALRPDWAHQRLSYGLLEPKSDLRQRLSRGPV